jgi:hypothetical protein
MRRLAIRRKLKKVVRARMNRMNKIRTISNISGSLWLRTKHF